jgi:hypothetical protein
MKLPRIRVRSLMIVVLLIAIVVYADVLRRRRAGFLRRAQALAAEEKISRGMRDGTRRVISQYEKNMEDFKDVLRREIARLKALDFDKKWIQQHEDFVRSLEMEQALTVSSGMADVARCSQRCDYFAALRRNYERAARYPWLPVSPDPAEPAPPELPLKPTPPNLPNAALLPAPSEPPPP